MKKKRIKRLITVVQNVLSDERLSPDCRNMMVDVAIMNDLRKAFNKLKSRKPPFQKIKVKGAEKKHERTNAN